MEHILNILRTFLLGLCLAVGGVACAAEQGIVVPAGAPMKAPPPPPKADPSAGKEMLVYTQGETDGPPERPASVSVNQVIKRQAEWQQDHPESAAPKAVSRLERAPVYRSLAEAAADGVGLRKHSDELAHGWYWWQWLGAVMAALIVGAVGVLGWATWRNRAH